MQRTLAEFKQNNSAHVEHANARLKNRTIGVGEGILKGFYDIMVSFSEIGTLEWTSFHTKQGYLDVGTRKSKLTTDLTLPRAARIRVQR